MAVGKRFEVYQESDDLGHPSGAEAYNPLNAQWAQTVKIYSLNGTQSTNINNYIVRPFSDQLWSRDLGLLASSSSSSLPVSFRERPGLSYKFNPYAIPYSLDGAGLITIQSPFQHVFLLPRALLETQETATW
jgi:hypothetical protein